MSFEHRISLHQSNNVRETCLRANKKMLLNTLILRAMYTQVYSIGEEDKRIILIVKP